MKIFKTEIWIDKQNRWWNGEQEIINQGVLKLFKMNLHYDKDYFIHLTYKDKEEKGYLKKVEGFPLICIDVIFENENIDLKLDNEAKTNLSNLFYDDERNAFWGLFLDESYRKFLPYILNSKSLQILQEYFIEENQKINIKKDNLNIPIINQKFDPYKINNRDK